MPLYAGELHESAELRRRRSRPQHDSSLCLHRPAVTLDLTDGRIEVVYTAAGDAHVVVEATCHEGDLTHGRQRAHELLEVLRCRRGGQPHVDEGVERAAHV